MGQSGGRAVYIVVAVALGLLGISICSGAGAALLYFGDPGTAPVPQAPPVAPVAPAAPVAPIPTPPAPEVPPTPSPTTPPVEPPAALDPPTPQVRGGTAEVRGDLARTVVVRVVRRHRREVEQCYRQELAVRPDAAGQVTVHFVISSSGTVQLAELSTSSIEDPSFEACMVQAVRRWTFPSAEGSVDVTYSFELSATRG